MICLYLTYPSFPYLSSYKKSFHVVSYQLSEFYKYLPIYKLHYWFKLIKPFQCQNVDFLHKDVLKHDTNINDELFLIFMEAMYMCQENFETFWDTIENPD